MQNYQLLLKSIQGKSKIDFPWCQHRPIFPGRFQPSIVGTDELNFRVRNGNGWTLAVKDTDFSLYFGLFSNRFQFILNSLLLTVAQIFEFARLLPRSLSIHRYCVELIFLCIYSLYCSLFRSQYLESVGAPSGTRTRDPLIKSQLLYQLS